MDKSCSKFKSSFSIRDPSPPACRSFIAIMLDLEIRHDTLRQQMATMEATKVVRDVKSIMQEEPGSVNATANVHRPERNKTQIHSLRDLLKETCKRSCTLHSAWTRTIDNVKDVSYQDGLNSFDTTQSIGLLLQSQFICLQQLTHNSWMPKR